MTPASPAPPPAAKRFFSGRGDAAPTRAKIAKPRKPEPSSRSPPVRSSNQSRVLKIAAALAGAAGLVALGLWIEVTTRPEAPRPIPALLAPKQPRADWSITAGDPDELLRLRAENARLRAQLQTDAKNRDEAKEELADALHELSELRRPLEIDMASSTLRASLKPGEGVVTGGYRLPDGSRLFAFLETNERAGGDIGVTGRFYAVSDNAAQSLGLQNLFTEAANTLQHGEVWAREEMENAAQGLTQPGASRAVGLGATTLSPGAASAVSLESNPPLSFRVYAERDAQNGLQLELRVESVPKP